MLILTFSFITSYMKIPPRRDNDIKQDYLPLAKSGLYYTVLPITIRYLNIK